MAVYIPISIFICLVSVMVVLVLIGLNTRGIIAILSSMVSFILAYISSKIAINGTLIENISGLDTDGNIVEGITTIELSALSYILLFVGIFMCVIFVIQVFREIKFRESEEIIELDL